MDSLFTSTMTVALAEIGDKTQLLALLLSIKFHNKTAIVIGILLATLINHGLSAWLGLYIGNILSTDVTNWILGGSFIAVGLWLLIPDKDEEVSGRFDKYGAFLATFILFFLAEIGDKTQIATVLLAAQYQSLWLVTAGTTLGMLIANIPIVFFGNRVMQKLPVKVVHLVAAALFCLIGISILFW